MISLPQDSLEAALEWGRGGGAVNSLDIPTSFQEVGRSSLLPTKN